ncbi:MAG: histone deacetylase [Chloroflexi bacterium]|nr:MAG: histone deacetylase [Chloroflexota bacterium]HDN80955.1 histone deacetylase [Chloroflexota bacterium]
MTGYVYHPIYLEHTCAGHPENHHRLKAIMELLKERDVLPHLQLVEPKPVSMELLERVHNPYYIKLVQRVAETGGGNLDMDTYVGPRSYEAALMAAGGVVEAVKAVLDGEVDSAFALVRPPGHHATPNRGMGFCLFNNVAIAARYALERDEVKRILIADFDVHHGNGTQDIFYRESSVLYFSTHQYPHYPGTGRITETGEGEGKGYTVNVPMRGRVGDEGYRRIFEEILWPIARRYHPDLVLVSAGFDAHWADPLASMLLSITGYTNLARILKAIADELCEGRIIFVLEGGYKLEVLSHCVLNIFYTLMGEEKLLDPLGPSPYREQPVDELIKVLKEIHNLSKQA